MKSSGTDGGSNKHSGDQPRHAFLRQKIIKMKIPKFKKIVNQDPLLTDLLRKKGASVPTKVGDVANWIKEIGEDLMETIIDVLTGEYRPPPTAEEIQYLELLKFASYDGCWKHTEESHKFIMTLFENGEDVSFT